MPPDPKNRARYVATPEEWTWLRQILLPTGSTCQCGCGRRAESLHHILSRGQGGDDVPANLVRLAGSGTTLCHGALTSGNKTDGVSPDAVASGIRANLRQDQIAYVRNREGQWYLDRHYPFSGEEE